MVEGQEVSTQVAEGLEGYVQVATSGVNFMKLVNGDLSADLGMLPGTLIIGSENIELVGPKDKLEFIPVFFYQQFIVQDGKQVIKTSFTNKGFWSDGSEIKSSEFEWQGTTPPVATPCINFCIIPKVNGKFDVSNFGILSLAFSNKHRKTAAIGLQALIKKETTDRKFNKVSQGVYSLSKDTFTSKKTEKNPNGNKWVDFCAPKFEGENTSISLEETSALYLTVKDINTKVYDKTNVVSNDTNIENVMEAEVVPEAGSEF